MHMQLWYATVMRKSGRTTDASECKLADATVLKVVILRSGKLADTSCFRVVSLKTVVWPLGK